MTEPPPDSNYGIRLELFHGFGTFLDILQGCLGLSLIPGLGFESGSLQYIRYPGGISAGMLISNDERLLISTHCCQHVEGTCR